MAVTPEALEKYRLENRLRDAVHDYMETDGANLHDAYSALSLVRSEVNVALGTQARLAGQPPFSNLSHLN